MKISEGGRTPHESIQAEARPGREGGDPPHIELITVASKLLGVRFLLGRADQRGHRDLVAAREMADHVEGADLPSPLGWVRHPVTEKENIHAWMNGAPSVP